MEKIHLNTIDKICLGILVCLILFVIIGLIMLSVRHSNCIKQGYEDYKPGLGCEIKGPWSYTEGKNITYYFPYKPCGLNNNDLSCNKNYIK